MGLSGHNKNRAFPGFIPKRPASDSVSFVVPVASSTQVLPVACGIPCIGFVVYPTHRRLKARKVINATRHLNERMDAWRRGDISFAELDASVKGAGTITFAMPIAGVCESMYSKNLQIVDNEFLHSRAKNRPLLAQRFRGQ